MKKEVILALVVFLLAINGYAQKGKDSITASATCSPPTIIDLTYDSCSHKISQNSQYGLSGKGYYIFRVGNVNSSLFTSKIVASNITRAVALPAVFNNILPSGNITTAQVNFAMEIVQPGAKDNNQTVSNYYFFQRYNFDYNILQYISSETKDLTVFLEKNWSDAAHCKSYAQGKIDEVKAKIKTLASSITISAEDLQKLKNEQARLQGIVDRRHAPPNDGFNRDTIKDQLETTTENINMHLDAIDTYTKLTNLDLNDVSVFRDFVASTLADFSSRVSLINIPQRYLSNAITNEQLTQINSSQVIINNSTAYLKSCPDIINAVKNCNSYIDSSPYTITGDYLNLNIALLRPKFSDKPDTVSQNKLKFYKYNYWKWIDVSAGFFYDNLASPAYYFLNAVPTKEIKSRADVSVGALLHSYYVASSFVKVGPCIGVGVSALDGKSKYLGGISFILGRNNEFAFSGGYALASLPKISNLYQSSTITTTTTTTTTTTGSTNTTTTGTTPSTANTTTSGTSTSTATVTAPIGTTGTVNTYNKFQGGFFIGITYSFLKL